MIEEAYCSFELAKKLFEKGMPQELDSYYGYAIRECYSSSDYSPKYNVGDEVVLDDGFAKADIVIAPTLSMVFKWLRDCKNIHIMIGTYDGGLLGENKNIWIPLLYYIRPIKALHTKETYYPSYEEALEAGINKALELI